MEKKSHLLNVIHQLKLAIRREQRWLRENPVCASNPRNYHAKVCRQRIKECKDMIKFYKDVLA